MAGYPGLNPEPINERHNAHSALSGNEFQPDLQSDDPEGDQKLRERILKTISDHPELKVQDLKVDVKEGFVSLRGVVTSEDERATITGLIQDMNGIYDVTNFLELDETSDIARGLSGDDDLTIGSPS
jgi:hypothetical protein